MQPLLQRKKKKAISITYSECVFVAIGIQHAMRTRLILICPPLQYFPTLSPKGHDFRKNLIEHKLFVTIFSPKFF